MERGLTVTEPRCLSQLGFACPSPQSIRWRKQPKRIRGWSAVRNGWGYNRLLRFGEIATRDRVESSADPVKPLPLYASCAGRT